MSEFGEIVFGTLMLAITMIVNGWGLSVVWNWYVPAIFGLPYLTLAQSLGLSIVIRMFVGSSSGESDKNKTFVERMLFTTILSVIMTLLFVGLAWVVRFWAF